MYQYDYERNTIRASSAKRAREWDAIEEGGAAVTIIAATRQQAETAAARWTRSGDWDCDDENNEKPCVVEVIVRPKSDWMDLSTIYVEVKGAP